MDERERELRRRRRRQRELMKRRRRRRMIVKSVIFFFLLICFAALFFSLKGCGEADSKNPSIEQQVVNTPEPTAEPEMITLTSVDIYKGDLILVNQEHEYRFEHNAEDIQLTTISDYQDGAIRSGKDDLKLAYRILEPLHRMISDCNQALGVDNNGVTSAYRSREYQEDVYRDYVDIGGVEYADAYVADPGFSEHHTGLSLDLGIHYHDGSEGRFSGSTNAQWMNDHCHEYGFIRRYKEDKIEITGISNEAWHFRYVGVPHASYMNANNLCMEEYISYLRSNTSKESPLTIVCSTGTYQVYVTKDKVIGRPEQEYTISGDNIDSYILTVRTGEP